MITITTIIILLAYIAGFIDFWYDLPIFGYQKGQREYTLEIKEFRVFLKTFFILVGCTPIAIDQFLRYAVFNDGNFILSMASFILIPAYIYINIPLAKEVWYNNSIKK